ncbi:S-adenosyl-L-methionine-dependent methyltransferase [Hyaloraphidium curvatum]|nr:S-adenosyl-L-methionine-dependent methyltransferase [Hyaloraphidium curvatum]
MTDKTVSKMWLSATPALAEASQAYSQQHSAAIPASVSRARERVAEDPVTAPHAIYLVPILEAQLLYVLAKLQGPGRVLEIGCFAGCSALIFLEAGAKELVTLELSDAFAGVAESNFAGAGFADRAKVLRGRALDSLLSLPSDSPFDTVFIDADKPGYLSYYRTIRERGLVRPGGLILCDNVLRRGLVLGGHEGSPFAGDKKLVKEAALMQEFNDYVAADQGVESVLLPLFDGLTVVRVK